MMFLFKLKYHWRAIKESASSLQKLHDHNQLFLLPQTTPGNYSKVTFLFFENLLIGHQLYCCNSSSTTAGELGEMLQIHLEVKRFQALLQALIRRNFFFHIDSSNEGTSNEYIVRELYLRQPSKVAANADEEALESEIAQFEKVSDIIGVVYTFTDSYRLSTVSVR
jgi:hypothetical protein